jgi:HEAT repeat protein
MNSRCFSVTIATVAFVVAVWGAAAAQPVGAPPPGAPVIAPVPPGAQVIPPVPPVPPALPVPMTIGPGPIGPGPMGIGPMGPGPVGSRPMGPGPIGLGPIGPGPMGIGPIGPVPMIAGPMMIRPGGLDISPMLAFEFSGEPQDRAKEAEQREKEREQREKERENRVYDEAHRFMDRREWDRAIERFNDVVVLKGSRADAALHWKAWSQHRNGQTSEALTTIATLAKEYPNSRYLKDAKALEVEVRRNTGQPVRPESQTDDGLKLLAIQGLSGADPEQTVPLLEKVLASPASPRVKERALFVLAQSNSPRAREVLKALARGSSTPELQAQAINYLGVHGGRESRAALAEVYSATTDVDVKRRIMRSFMVSGERDRLLSLAQSEQNPGLRSEAVKQLGVMGAHEALWTLYQKESSLDVKKQILHSMFVAGQAPRMIELAKSEQNVELRKVAVRNLGLMGGKATAGALVEIYLSDRDPSIRSNVIQALFIQGDAGSLVSLARKEADPTRKTEIVQKLSLMGDHPAAKDYMLELLSK